MGAIGPMLSEDAEPALEIGQLFDWALGGGMGGG